MKRWGTAFSLLLGCTFGCEGSRTVEVEFVLSRPPCSESEPCGKLLYGTGLMVRAKSPQGDELATYDGQRTLYAEARMPSGATAVVELAFNGGASSVVRYREIKNGRVVFRGQVSDANVVAPGWNGSHWTAGRFSFVASNGESMRKIEEGIIIPEGADTVEVTPGQYRQSNVDVGCGGEVVVVDPIDRDPYTWPPDDPYDPPPPPPDNVDSPYEDPVYVNDSGGCDGDEPYPPDTDPDDPWADDSGGGCDGDSSEPETSDSGCDGDSSEPDTSDSGCGGSDSGDDYDSGGCEGDSSSSDSAGGCDGGESDSCEGDAAAASVVVFTPRMLASLWRLFWPISLAGGFNRYLRRRR